MYLTSVDHAYVYAYYIENENRKLVFKLVPSCQLDNGDYLSGQKANEYWDMLDEAMGMVGESYGFNHAKRKN